MYRKQAPEEVINSVKTCTTCSISKDKTEFVKSKANKDGLSWRCKSCDKEYRQRFFANKSPDYRKREGLKRLYGITLEQYNELSNQQNNCCAVCLKPATRFKKGLATDHSHVTGEIRGLLCGMCNRYVIGNIEDPEVFARASEYLRKGTGLFVPETYLKGARKKRSHRKKTK